MTIAGPAWDLSSEYAAPEDPAVARDIDHIDARLAELSRVNASFAPLLEGIADQTSAKSSAAIEAARVAHGLLDDASTHLSNLYTYAQCRLSVDGQDVQARELQGHLESRQKKLTEASQPLSQFINAASDEVIDSFLADPRTRSATWSVKHGRERRHERLGLNEETLVGALSMDGIHAWGKLYTQLSSTLQCEVMNGNELQKMGLASAAGLMMKPEVATRRSAWQAINQAWGEHEESCAAALNAIAGWRLEMVRRRSHRQAVHFLDAPLHANTIQRATLDALLAVAKEARPIARRAARLQAFAHGESKYGPWDNRAPAPIQPGGREESIAFEDGLALIATTYANIDPEMGEFVAMMGKKCWIEGTIGDRKRPGAYQTEFEKSRTPRIYMTYTGATSDVITLAHELGHAFHSWVMRDLSNVERSFGMSVAETASTFGETIVREALMAQANTSASAFEIAWQDAEAAVAFILNIPARFEFERNFYERRSERPLQVAEFKQLMGDAWRACYGDVLAEPDDMFWASKLHFFISGLSFYNFPYLFGYLFSLGIYAQRAHLGAGFYPAYKALLRDTGRMSAEQLAKQHLGVDLTQPQFWRDSVKLVEKSVENFEGLARKVGVATA